MSNSLKFETMRAGGIEMAVDLVELAMNQHQASYARKTYERHFLLRGQGIDDGREYFTLFEDDVLVGISGLHHWVWGPPENVWLGWFAVRPDRQREGIGSRLLLDTEQRASMMGYRKLFVETYIHEAFERAGCFYLSRGFKEAGKISDWLSDGEPMIVYYKKLEDQ